MRSLDLLLDGRRVGVVEPASRDRSKVTLTVDSQYDGDVLLSEAFATIPGRRPPDDAVSNFLGGYVPEGNHREAMAAKRHIDKGDLFALLREFGGSIAGAVTMVDPDEPSGRTPVYEPLDGRALAARLRQALNDSDQGIPEDSRSTLPGYQPKVLVARFDDAWLLPRGRAHSTHILKPQVPSRPSRIFDEHYGHLLAQHIGLSRYHSAIHRVGRLPFLAIERYDRTVVNGRVVLHHQEDLAQALGLDWPDTDVKFQSPDWPTDNNRASAKSIAHLLGSIPGGDKNVERWLRQLVFHIAIGNNDAHAKNVALMHLPSGTELAQVYDAVPNLFRADLAKYDMAFAIDGVFDHRRISAERILAETKTWAVLSASAAERILVSTLAEVDAALESVDPPAGVSDGIVDRLAWNVSRLRAGKEISTPRR